jgi:hypothetical protein
MEEIAFSDAERLFDSIMGRIEAHLEQMSAGMSGLQYHFVDMGALKEHRRIEVSFRDAHRGDQRAEIFMPGAGVWRKGAYDMDLELTGQEYDTFLALVWLGACLGFWPVDGLLTERGESVYLMLPQKPMISPMAILAAFASGELEAEWPNRKKHIENAWFLWQARHAVQSSYYESQIREQGGGAGAEIWKSDEGPDYL